VMKKTQDYLSGFARFKSEEAIHSVERYNVGGLYLLADGCQGSSE